MFDEMLSYPEEFTGGVLRVTVHYLYYPVTEEILQQVFEAYGVAKISLFQRIDHVEAVVQFRSRRGAAQALALQGRCIYEGSCLLDIQDVSPAAPAANSDLGELCDQIRDQLQKLSEMLHTASQSTSSSLPEIINEESGCEHEYTHSDISTKVAAPMVCGADYGVIAADTSSLATLTHTSCSMVCPRNDATVDVFPKLPASAESDENLDLDTAAVAPATYSTGGLAHGCDGDSPPAVSLVLWTMTSSSTACSPDRSFAGGVPRPLPWPSFPCDGDSKRLTYSWPATATQGTLLCLQPKPPWVYSSQALLSKGPRCDNLNLLASCWNFSSPEPPLFGHGWFISYSVTALILQKNWDPGGMLHSGSAPLAFPTATPTSPRWSPPALELMSTTPTRCLHPQGLVFWPAPWPSFTEKRTSTACGGTVEPAPSTFMASNIAIVPCLSQCFEDDIHVLIPIYTPDANVNIKQPGRVLQPMSWMSFKFHSEADSAKDPCTTAEDIFVRLSTCQPHEDPSSYAVSYYLLNWTSSSDGHYLQVLTTLRNFLYEFYNIGEVWDRWQCERLQQSSSADRASCLECTSVGGNTLSMEWKVPCLFSGMLVAVACRQNGGICYFFIKSEQEEKSNSISASGKQVIQLGYIELIPWVNSLLHFIKPCNSSLVIQKFGTNGRLSPEVEFSGNGTNGSIVHVPRDTIQLQSWLPPSHGTGYGGIFQYNIAAMLGSPHYLVPNNSVSAFITAYKMVLVCCWLLRVEALLDVSPLCDPVVNKRRITRLAAGDLQMMPSAVAGQFLNTPYVIQNMKKAMDRVQHCTWCLPGYSTIPRIKRYLPPGCGIAYTQMFCLELGILNTTRHIYEEDCHFFHQLVINSEIIYTNLLLPFDPGGLALWLYKIAGIPDSRLFIIGLRASRILREGECNTPSMGYYYTVCNLGLGYDMGQGPPLCACVGLV